jgi:hypothetical protein
VSTGKPETLSLKVEREIEEQKEDEEGSSLYKTPPFTALDKPFPFLADANASAIFLLKFTHKFFPPYLPRGLK